MSLEWIALGCFWEGALSRRNLSQDTSTQSVFFVGMARKTERYFWQIAVRNNLCCHFKDLLGPFLFAQKCPNYLFGMQGILFIKKNH